MFEKSIQFVMDEELLNQDFIRNRHNVETIERIYSCKKIKQNTFFSQESAPDMITDDEKASKLIH